MRPNTPVLVALALAVGLSTTACEEEEPAPAAAPVAAAPRPAAAAPDAGTSTAAAELYVYDPVAKRDPFRSPTNDVSPRGDANCADPLCQFDLDQLTLVAVVTGDANPL